MLVGIQRSQRVDLQTRKTTEPLTISRNHGFSCSQSRFDTIFLTTHFSPIFVTRRSKHSSSVQLRTHWVNILASWAVRIARQNLFGKTVRRNWTSGLRAEQTTTKWWLPSGPEAGNVEPARARMTPEKRQQLPVDKRSGPRLVHLMEPTPK